MSKETLTLKNGEASSSPAPKGKASDVAKKIFESARAKSMDVKHDSGKINHPKFVDKGKDFRGAKMKDRFESGILKNVDFRNADLTDADFTWMEEVTNSKTKSVTHVKRGFIVQGCDFRGATLDGTNFAGCDLRWSNFQGTDWGGALLGDLDDDGNVINQANIKEVDGMTR